MSQNRAAPASIVLKELLDDKKASREQQMRILEHRYNVLVSCMRNYSQKTLGQLACLDSGDGSYHELRQDSPRILSVNDEFNLNTRGFFARNLFTREKHGQRLAFGIYQDSWLLLKINYNDEDGNRVWPNKHEVALSVEVARSDLSTILDEIGLEPSDIWMYLKMITEEWVSNRKNLYDQACKVAQGMNEEDCIFRMIA